MSTTASAADELAELLEVSRVTGNFLPFYSATAPRIRRCLQRYLHSHATTEDAMQEVFVRVWQRSGSFDASRGLAIQWLSAIARNLAIDILRGQKRERQAAAVPELQDSTPPSTVWPRTLALHFQLSLQNLSASQQRLIHLAFVEDLSYRDIAKLTMLPEGSVKSQIRRALLTLRRDFQDS